MEEMRVVLPAANAIEPAALLSMTGCKENTSRIDPEKFVVVSSANAMLYTANKLTTSVVFNKKFVFMSVSFMN
jgi:hypothetical protein